MEKQRGKKVQKEKGGERREKTTEENKKEVRDHPSLLGTREEAPEEDEVNIAQEAVNSAEVVAHRVLGKEAAHTTHIHPVENSHLAIVLHNNNNQRYIPKRAPT